MTTSTEKPKRTPEEQRILAIVAAVEGPEFAEANANLILEQAREIGELRRRDKGRRLRKVRETRRYALSAT